jgi:hypothetical protein
MPMPKPPKLARWDRLRNRAQQTHVKSRRRAEPGYPTKVVRTRQTRVP